MWKHKNFINLQLWAGNIVATTINWDSHITKVVLGTIWEWTQSGQTDSQSGYVANDFVVTLPDDYVIDTVTATNGFTISNITDTTFHLNDGNTGGDLKTEVTITITSKQSTPQPTLTFKHFYDAGTVGSGTYKFRHYSQQEPSSGETWVLNNNNLSGTLAMTNIAFTSNSEDFTSIKAINYGPGGYGVFYNDKNAYHRSESAEYWSNDAYRTITFATSPTGDLLTWLQANGTKQGGGGAVK